MIKQLLTHSLLALLFTTTTAQNWQYVGSPYINQTAGTTTYLYFPDPEFNVAGDIFVGYWEYNGALSVAQYTSNAWSQLPSPGSHPVSQLDLEVQGTNYYLAYSRVRGSNMYCYVQQYTGGSWVQLGDSMLLGNSGSGGYFEFLLDNNGVPTVLGVVATTIGANKQVMQYGSASWSSVYTFSNSAATVFRENSAIFNSQNKLICATEGYVTVPSFQYFTVISELTGSARVTLGDTLWGTMGAHRVKLDANDIPYLCANGTTSSEVLAYKLNGSAWSFVGDTAGPTIGTMIAADMTNTGTIVFNTLTANIDRSIYIYSNNTRSSMDSVNVSGFAVGSIADIVIPTGSNDAYIVIIEIKSNAAQDISVLKHAIAGSSGITSPESYRQMLVYPNPSEGIFTMQWNGNKGASIEVLNMLGEKVVEQPVSTLNGQLNLSGSKKGVYFVQVYDGEKRHTQKIIIQ